jgi:hypothetical protein
MGKISKTLALFLTLIVATSCLTLIAVKSVNAQTTPTDMPNPQTAPDYGSWTRIATMPSADPNCGTAVLNGIIYVIGENASDYAYNPSRDTWTTIAPLPTSRVNFVVTACYNKIFVMGGFNRTSSLSYSLNEAYDPLKQYMDHCSPNAHVQRSNERCHG